MVEAVRGAGGGYRFSGNAKRISLYDVIHLFGDSVGGGNDMPLPASDTDMGIALDRVLKEVDEISVATLKSISLATLIKSRDWAPRTPATNV